MNTQHLRHIVASLRLLRAGGLRWSGVRLAAFALLLCLSGVHNAATLQGVGGFGPSSPENIGPVGSQIDNGIHAAQDLSVSSSNPTAVGLRWLHKGAQQTLVKRSVNGGPWETIQTYGALPGDAYTLFRDHGATANAENCYVIVVTDGLHPGSALSTPQRCYCTRDGRDLPVHRLQLRLRVPNVAGTATDDDVEVRLQSPSGLLPSGTNWRPAGNSTWIGSTAADFARRSSRTYDLMLTNIAQVSDITMITITKDTGTDNLCIAEIELLIDGQPAYQRTFGEDAATCAWVTAGHPLSVQFHELRASSLWNTLSLPTCVGIDGAGLRSVIEAIFAHELHGSKGALRHGGTTTSQRLSESKLHVAVPLVVHDVSLGPVSLGDVNSIVYFDLVMTPVVVDGSPATEISVENPDAESFNLLTVFFPAVVVPILYGVASEIETQVADFDPVPIPPAPMAGTHPCFTQEGGLGMCFDSGAR